MNDVTDLGKKRLLHITNFVDFDHKVKREATRAYTPRNNYSMEQKLLPEAIIIPKGISRT